MSKSTRTDTLVMQAIRGVKRNRQGSAKTRHNHIKEARRFVNTIRELGYGATSGQRWTHLPPEIGPTKPERTAGHP